MGRSPSADRLEEGPDVGDLVVILLASSLAGLRDTLYEDGFCEAAELVADLVEILDDHICAQRRSEEGS